MRLPARKVQSGLTGCDNLKFLKNNNEHRTRKVECHHSVFDVLCFYLRSLICCLSTLRIPFYNHINITLRKWTILRHPFVGHGNRVYDSCLDGCMPGYDLWIGIKRRRPSFPKSSWTMTRQTVVADNCFDAGKVNFIFRRNRFLFTGMKKDHAGHAYPSAYSNYFLHRSSFFWDEN